MFSSPPPPSFRRTPIAKPQLQPQPQLESEFSDDSSSGSDDETRLRPRRARHRRLRTNPALYTLHELDENLLLDSDDDDGTTTAVPSASRSLAPTPRPTAPTPPTPPTPVLRGLSIIVPGAPPVLSAPVPVLHTPGSENEDPFALDDLWAEFDEAASASSPSPKKASKRRPPPLDLTVDLGRDSDLPALRYPVSPHQLSPDRPNTPSAPRRAPLPLPPVSPRSPRTPPSPATHAFEWEAYSLRMPRAPRSPPSRPPASEPSTPVTPTTPDSLVSALRELLTSCGEYDDFAHDDMFSAFGAAKLPAAPAVDLTDMIVPPPRSGSLPHIRRRRPARERPLATLFADSFVPSPPPPARRGSDATLDAEDGEDGDDAQSFRSCGSLPELGYSSSEASISLPVSRSPPADEDSDVEEPSLPPSPALGSHTLYSLPNSGLLGLGLGIDADAHGQVEVDNVPEKSVRSLGRSTRSARRIRLPLPWAN